MSQFRITDMSVKLKLGVLTAFFMSIIATISISSWINMSSIGVEIKAITEQDIPLSATIVEITTNQLEQVIEFERALRTGIAMQGNKAEEEHFKHAVRLFEELTHEVDEEVVAAEELVANAIKDAYSIEAREEFEHIESILKDIEHKHAAYEKEAMKIFTTLAQGDIHATEEEAVEAEQHGDELDKVLEALTDEIEGFTLVSSEKALEHEKSAITTLTIIASTSFVIGIIFAFWITRTILSQLGAEPTIVRDFAERIAAGNLVVDSNEYAGTQCCH